MKEADFLPIAFFAMVALMSCAPAIADPPPVCVAVQCASQEFLAVDNQYTCPKKTLFNIPLEASLHCSSSNPYTLACEAHPLEVNTPTCGGDPVNLVYDWTVELSNGTYPYPPSYDNKISVSCMPTENVSVSVTVWNGTSSSSSTSNLNCGDVAQ